MDDRCFVLVVVLFRLFGVLSWFLSSAIGVVVVASLLKCSSVMMASFSSSGS